MTNKQQNNGDIVGGIIIGSLIIGASLFGATYVGHHLTAQYEESIIAADTPKNQDDAQLDNDDTDIDDVNDADDIVKSDDTDLADADDEINDETESDESDAAEADIVDDVDNGDDIDDESVDETETDDTQAPEDVAAPWADDTTWYDAAAAEIQQLSGRPTKSGTIPVEDIKKMLDQLPQKWGTDWDIVIVEYSDFECGYCQRHNAAGTINTIIENNDDVAKAFGHFPLNFHPNAQPSAEALECIVDQAGEDAFFDYADKIFNLGTPSVNNIKTMLQAEGKLNIDKFTTCVESGDKAKDVKGQMTLGQTYFGITGTPGNVVINKKTGEFVVIAGAFPLNTFQTVVNLAKKEAS